MRPVARKRERRSGRGHAIAQEDSSDLEDSPIDGESSLIGALIDAAVTQVVNSSTDEAHYVCGEANEMLFATKNRGLLYGPYNPKFEKEQE